RVVSYDCSMPTIDSSRTDSFPEHRLAWLVAIVADAIQIVGLPFFAEGVLSPLDTLLDVIVAAILTRLLGWHWAFLPGLIAELIPGLDLFPSWTAAVFYVTSKRVLTRRAANRRGQRTPFFAATEGDDAIDSGKQRSP